MINRRKVGMMSSPYGHYVQGYTRATMDGTKSCDTERGSSPRIACLISDWKLTHGPMEVGALVIADEHAAVDTFPGLVHTARPSTGVDWSRSA